MTLKFIDLKPGVDEKMVSKVREERSLGKQKHVCQADKVQGRTGNAGKYLGGQWCLHLSQG
jgi:hypothetical protein